MRKLFLLLGLVLFPALSWAVPVSVVSGEHTDFSRIVVQFGNVTEWEFGRVDDGFELRSDTLNADFDFSQVFLLIPRNRITAISAPGPGRVLLTVSCTCFGDAFEIRQGHVVIDIKDGLPPPTARFETRLREPASPPKERKTADLSALDIEFRADANTDNAQPWQSKSAPLPAKFLSPPPARQHSGLAATGRELLVVNAQDLPKEGTKPLLPVWPEKPIISTIRTPGEPAARAGISEQILLRQLSRAAAQGLVSVDLLPKPDTSDDPVYGSPVTAGPNEAPKPIQATPNVTAGEIQNLHIQTSVDRDSNLHRTVIPRNEQGISCLPAEDFEVSTWGETETVAGHYSNLRADLVSEFDKPNILTIKALAKRYLFLGFGAEAELLLQSFDVEIPEADILLQIAKILEQETASNPGLLGHQLSCKTPGALWAFLSLSEFSVGAEIAQNSVLRAFSSLPPHLRQHLGPKIVTNFLAIGDHASADAARKIAARVAPDDAPALQMMAARIAEYKGDLNAALRHFAKVAATSDISAPEALLNLIDTLLEADLPIDEKTAEFADAMAAEYSGTEYGGPLTIAAIRAFATNGQIDTTFERINSALQEEDISPAQAAALSIEAHNRNTELSSDTDFVSNVYRNDFAPRPKVAKDQIVLRAIARRLLTLGLPQKVPALYAKSAHQKEAADLHILAQVDLALGDPTGTIEKLDGIADQPAKTLKANANSLLRNFAEASKIYTELGLSEDQHSAAWRGREWNALASANLGPRSDFANMIIAAERAVSQVRGSADMDPGPDTPDNDGQPGEAPEDSHTLAANKMLLEHSQRTREIIEGLLKTQ